MMERVAFLAVLGFTIAAFGVAAIGALHLAQGTGDSSWFFLGLGGLLGSRWFFAFGREHWHFGEVDEAFSYQDRSTWPFGSDGEHEQRARSLRAIFDRLDRLYAQDQLGQEQVWAVHELRRELNTLIRQDPALRSQFAGELSVHRRHVL